jgi:hypothetical protein
MASPTNWLLFESGVVALIVVIELIVVRAATRQNKLFGINGQ